MYTTSRCDSIMLKGRQSYTIRAAGIIHSSSYDASFRPLSTSAPLCRSLSNTAYWTLCPSCRRGSNLWTQSNTCQLLFTMRCSRVFFSSTTTSLCVVSHSEGVMGSDGGQVSETISPEMIEVECITVETSVNEVEDHTQRNKGTEAFTSFSSSTSTDSNSKVRPTGAAEGSVDSKNSSTSWSTGTGGGEPYWNVQKVDPFSRGRVINFLRRMGFKGAGSPFKIKATPVAGGQQMEVDDVNPTATTTVLYTATLRVPLPPPHGSYVAEGIGETVKDAELLAAMHAERVCDALGVPLFRLPSMQQKYAENVRRTEGRYAPLPGDPMRPEGSPVPPPLRMVSAAVEKEHGCGSSHTETSTKHSLNSGRPISSNESLFSPSIAEAEIVEERKSAKHAGSRSACMSANGKPSTQVRITSPSDTSSSTQDNNNEWVSEYRNSMIFPWGKNTISRSGNTNGVTGNFQSATPSSFDPTEGGCWQMVNIISLRRPPTTEALALPCVLDVEAMERLKDNFLQRGVGKRLEDCFTLTHVVLPGSASRMYVAELDLHLNTGSTIIYGDAESIQQRQRFASLQAMGKAQSKEVAKQLAAMHAELLLDALGQPLFPTDDARQSCHAAAAAKFGRWAIDPTAADYSVQKTLLEARLLEMTLPLPLKQLVGGEEVWLDPSTPNLHQAYQRTEGERVVAAQNELNFLCSDALEVYPPQSLLDEAEELLKRWQLGVVQNPYPECFVLTKMGDFYRAATITPVPRPFGVRGGIAIARTPAQAVGLCALHAVDSLCALGIPLFTNAAEQSAFMMKRKRMGLPTPDLFIGRLHPRDWEPLEPAIWHEEEFAAHTRNIMLEAEVHGKDLKSTTTEGGLSMKESFLPTVFWWKYLMQAMTHRTTPGYAVPSTSPSIPQLNHKNTQNKKPVLLPPYLPAYLMEGNQPRRLPHAADTRTVLQLAVLRDFDEFGKFCSEEELIHIGNEVKVCVHNYMKHQYALNSGGKGGWDSSTPLPLVPAVCITGYGRTGASVHNIAYLRLPPPIKKQTTAASGIEPSISAPKAKSSKKMKRLIQLNSVSIPPISTEEACSEGTEKSVCAVESTPETEKQVPESTPENADSYVPLAVGISLKKKDAERACYLHAASILYYVYGEDVMAKHRAGLPRLSLVSSFDTLLEKCFKGLYTDRSTKAPTDTSTAVCGNGLNQRDDDYQQGEKNCSANHLTLPPPPKPLIHTTMKTFVSAGRYVTAQKVKRSPF